MDKHLTKTSLTLSGFLIAFFGAVLFSTKAVIVKKAFADLDDADGKVRQDWDAHSLTLDDLPLGFCKILMGTMTACGAMPAMPTRSCRAPTIPATLVPCESSLSGLVAQSAHG